MESVFCLERQGDVGVTLAMERRCESREEFSFPVITDDASSEAGKLPFNAFPVSVTTLGQSLR